MLANILELYNMKHIVIKRQGQICLLYVAYFRQLTKVFYCEIKF